VLPAHPKWTVEDLRKIVPPRSALPVEVGELIPGWSSYDRLIEENREVSDVG